MYMIHVMGLINICDNAQGSELATILFIVKLSTLLESLFTHWIKLNLSICDSNQTWDSSQLYIFKSKPVVNS